MTVTCPSCRRVIPLQPGDEGRTIECAQCGQRFKIAQPEPLPSVAPTHCFGCNRIVHNFIACPRCAVEFCSELCLRRHFKETGHNLVKAEQVSGLIAAAVLLFFFLVCGGLAIIFSKGGKGAQDRSAPPAVQVAAVDAPTEQAGDGSDNDAPRRAEPQNERKESATDYGPYPESKAIVDYLQRNAPVASSVEILEWLGRKPVEKWQGQKLKGTRVHVHVKFRYGNEYGGKSVMDRYMVVIDGQVVGGFEWK